jgi:hypothetical protein
VKIQTFGGLQLRKSSASEIVFRTDIDEDVIGRVVVGGGGGVERFDYGNVKKWSEDVLILFVDARDARLRFGCLFNPQ